MFQYIIRRILITLPVILGVCTLTFLLIHFVPGDPVDIMLGDQAASVDKQALRASLGLDKPMLTQFIDFMTQLSHGQLGESLHSKKAVTALIGSRIMPTVELTFAAMLMAILVGLPLGVFAAIKQYSFMDNSVLVGSLFAMSIPGFFLGPLLIWVFAILLQWFPVSERNGLMSLVLPALSLALPLGAILARMTRASMLETVKEDYIQVARSKGISFFHIYFKHALKNALMPVVTIIGLQIGALLTGTVITESIFDWPGIGSLLFNSIQERDYPVVQGCILLISLTYVIINLLTDIAYAFVNPKVHLS